LLGFEKMKNNYKGGESNRMIDSFLASFQLGIVALDETIEL
jgi:hypothetical protein